MLKTEKDSITAESENIKKAWNTPEIKCHGGAECTENSSGLATDSTTTSMS